jgi:hypothetical protein
MRNISFALTTEQVRRREKTVTRRVGWKFLKAGDLLQPIEKGQGIPKGGHVTKIGGPIRVVKASSEWMSGFRSRADAAAECAREGFPEMTPAEFYAFFRGSHDDPGADDLLVTRIEFLYVD